MVTFCSVVPATALMHLIASFSAILEVVIRALWTQERSCRRQIVQNKPGQRSGRGVPQSTLFTFEGLSPALTEKRPSNRSARQTNNVAQFCFRWREDVSRI